MKRIAFATCLVAAMCLPVRGPLLSQEHVRQQETNPARKSAPPAACPALKSIPVDICGLALQLSAGKPSSSHPQAESLDGENGYVVESHGRRVVLQQGHEELALRSRVDEVVWFCKESKLSFEISKIQRVSNLQAEPAPWGSSSPFCAAFNQNEIGKIQPPGANLHSGAPVVSPCQRYKYSFKVGRRDGNTWVDGTTIEIDPHLIVTDPNHRPTKPGDPCDQR